VLKHLAVWKSLLAPAQPAGRDLPVAGLVSHPNWCCWQRHIVVYLLLYGSFYSRGKSVRLIIEKTYVLLMLVVGMSLVACAQESADTATQDDPAAAAQDTMAPPSSPVAQGDMDRSILPIQPPVAAPITEMDARNVTKPEPFVVDAPEGAPNVVIVLIDDIGFGATAPFGGAIETPALQQLADEGLRFNRFHTTALCSPTRAA
jgi:hypothetical protein